MLLFFAIFISSASGQQRLQFHVLDFSLDAFDTFDMSARDGQYKKYDGSGSLYAIVKVQGSTPDDLREYRFSFGNMNHLVEDHDGQLWLYVQKTYNSEHNKSRILQIIYQNRYKIRSQCLFNAGSLT